MQVVLRKYQRAKPRKCWGTFANKGLLNCTALTMLLHWSCTDSPPAPWWQPGWGDRDGQGVQTQVWEEEQGEISGGDGWWDTDVGFVTQGSKKSGNLKSDGLDFGDGTEHGKYRWDNEIQESKPRSFQRARVAGAREGGKTCRYTGCPWRRCWGVSNVEVSVELFLILLIVYCSFSTISDFWTNVARRVSLRRRTSILQSTDDERREPRPGPAVSNQSWARWWKLLHCHNSVKEPSWEAGGQAGRGDWVWRPVHWVRQVGVLSSRVILTMFKLMETSSIFLLRWNLFLHNPRP